MYIKPCFLLIFTVIIYHKEKMEIGFILSLNRLIVSYKYEVN